jgi:hypothetical protein
MRRGTLAGAGLAKEPRVGYRHAPQTKDDKPSKLCSDAVELETSGGVTIV